MKCSHIALFVTLALLLINVPVSESVTCNPMQLSSCASAILASAPPTSACCTKLKEQKPCLCQYLKNPNLKKYINNGNAKRVSRACSTPFPNC
ncbi:non-specific lipid-transfer protein 2-like [Magnolia sinica]|uniref:non-specific lipid-transfer protein 2-like n=1 Tax=Magnolia sinica TaxID=86752 RepID=UPI002658FB88|nr:non-specific lipid-transfer protein 2-like [Magnolia sinica]